MSEDQVLEDDRPSRRWLRLRERRHRVGGAPAMKVRERPMPAPDVWLAQRARVVPAPRAATA